MIPFNTIDRFRGWVLLLLYVMMVLFGILLIFSTITLWPLLGGKHFTAGVLMACSTITALLSMKSLQTFIHVLRVEKGTPKIEIIPFFAMLLTLLIATRLFDDL